MTLDTKKTKKLRFRKLFRLAQTPIKEDNEKVDLSLLKKLATTKEHEDILNLIEHETISTVRDAWVAYFLKITKQSRGKGD